MNPPQQPQDSRNTMMFLVAALVIMFAYEFFVARPQAERQRAYLAQQQAQQLKTHPAPAAPVVLTSEQALKLGPRVPIDTPELKGSINLNGALIDDLYLKDYKATVDKNSPPVELFRPAGGAGAYYAVVGWGGAPDLPKAGTPWKLVSGATLSPGQPVVLEYDAPSGVKVQRTLEVDNRYLFTVTDRLTNASSAPVTAAIEADVTRYGVPPVDPKARSSFEGAVGVFPSEGNFPDKKINFKDWKKKGTTQEQATGGWYGLTDKYWLGAVMPADQATPVSAGFRYNSTSDTYTSAFVGPVQTVAPGAAITRKVEIFAGAKKDDVLQQYSKTLGVKNLRLAIDWGFFWFLTQPLFWLLMHIWMGVKAVFGPFADSLGVSILLLTVVVRGAMFPLAFQSYASMSKMKKVQPLVEELRKKYADDQMKQQQEMMALYQREKINPIAGCVPMLATIPVFIALYTMLFATIELRQQPFLWIKDLALPDPSTVFNLFGLIPWDPASLPLVGFAFATFLHIGVWPLLYGLTTFLQMQMSPASTDPTQQAMMKFMPFIFMAFLASVPVGLLIYYVWSNIITIVQQWFMMNRHGVENPIDSFLQRLRNRAISSKAAG